MVKRSIIINNFESWVGKHNIKYIVGPFEEVMQTQFFVNCKQFSVNCKQLLAFPSYKPTSFPYYS